MRSEGSLGIEALNSFNIIISYGPVTWSDQMNHKILINDDNFGSGGCIYH